MFIVKGRGALRSVCLCSVPQIKIQLESTTAAFGSKCITDEESSFFAILAENRRGKQCSSDNNNDCDDYEDLLHGNSPSNVFFKVG